MPDDKDNVPSFHGVSTHAVDDSRRVMIPVKWRPKDPSVVFMVLAWPIAGKEFLLVLPPDGWRAMKEKMKSNSLTDTRVATLERVMGSISVPLTLDRVGRFCLPENLAEAVGISKEAQFVGRMDKFEIWDPKRFEKANAQDEAVAAEIAAKLL
jgi:division/cell wall cluster transcriptional repressor MraZ